MAKTLFRVLLIVIALLAAAALFCLLVYESVDEHSFPEVHVRAPGLVLSPVESDWSTAVLGGLLHKAGWHEDSGAAADLGEVLDFPGPFTFEEGYAATLELFREDEAVLLEDGPLPGDYECLICLEKPKEGRGSYGRFTFRLSFTVPEPEPEFFTGEDALRQGEVFVVRLTNVPKGETPAASTELGMSVFMPAGEGEWLAAIPVGNTRPPGVYTVSVATSSVKWEAKVTVKAFAFDTQNLIIDTSDPVISEANSPAAYAQYREKIPPLYETFDNEMHWGGVFAMPASGRISTQFGSIRYTNSNWSSPRHHWGVDIAADRGTPVNAPNGGRVVFAEYLLNTGNTAVIEHGGGLKSYYYHMDALHVRPGDMVKKGDRIGDVGSTGYSTGPHLHFETRIGNQAINPLMLCEASSSLLFFEETAGQL